MLHAELIDSIEKKVDDVQFSGVISIDGSEQVVFEKAFGYADRSNKLPNTVDTRFAIASGTKFFTALTTSSFILHISD